MTINANIFKSHIKVHHGIKQNVYLSETTKLFEFFLSHDEVIPRW